MEMLLLSVAEAAARCRVRPSLIYRLLSQGRISCAFKIGRYWRLPWPQL